MKQYTVKLRGESLIIVTGEIILFDSAMPILKKENVNYFNVGDVVYILPNELPPIK
ncbi:TPA: hypothetical protein ACGW65_003330 [Bacillus paranthracis]